MNHQSLSAFIWSVADLLRGDYKQADYGKVILPFTVLRRLDCVLEPTKAAVLAEHAEKQKAGLNPEPFVLRKAGQSFANVSRLDMHKLMGDQDNIAQNLYAYIQGFSPSVRDIFERFDFVTQVDRLAKNKLLYLVTERFTKIDLHPDKVDNTQMGLVFEELIRRFAELSNETAGEHFTPREVIRLMVDLIFVEDNEALTKPGVVRTIYDPTAGTGGMLSVAEEHLTAMNPKARLTMYGQELNPEILRDLQGRHAHQGAGCRQYNLRQHLHRGRAPVSQVRLHAVEPAFRRRMEEGREGGSQGARDAGLQRAFRSRFAARVGWLAAVPHAPSFEDAAGGRRRQPVRHRAKWLAALHRRRGIGRERDTALRAGERPRRGDNRPANRHVLQYRYFDLCLDFVEPEARAAQRQGAN